jgi:4-carboxymuconolactone decarboxylase
MSSSANTGSNKDEQARQQARQTLFEQGQQIRREVTGAAHVEQSWGRASDFTRPMQELATEAGWGLIWGRPGGLDRRTRSLLNVAMLAAMGKSTELAVHVRGALTNGVPESEISEALLQVAVYAGLPAGMEGFRIAQAVLDEEREKSEAAM